VGAFSRTNAWSPPGADELLDCWAAPVAGKIPAKRQSKLAKTIANDRVLRIVMEGPCLKV
jgi:hypothetical protein